MCVIIVGKAGGKKPTLATLRKCAAINRDGAGVAWSDGERVHFSKGMLSAKEVHRLIRAASGDWVAHFRKTTVGPSTVGLCHPIPIEANAPLVAKGDTGRALFHNGTWAGWRRAMRDAALKQGARLPSGPVSDSRAIAWLVHRTSVALLRLLPGRFVYMTKDGAKVFPEDRSTWTERAGIWYSNVRWLNTGKRIKLTDPVPTQHIFSEGENESLEARALQREMWDEGDYGKARESYAKRRGTKLAKLMTSREAAEALEASAMDLGPIDEDDVREALEDAGKTLAKRKAKTKRKAKAKKKTTAAKAGAKTDTSKAKAKGKRVVKPRALTQGK